MSHLGLNDINNDMVVLNTDHIDFINITSEEQKSGAIALSSKSYDVCIGTGNVKYHFTLVERELWDLAKALDLKVVNTAGEVEVV